MRPAAERLAPRLQQVALRTPEIPVVNNVDVAVETDPDRIRDALVRQAWNAVRWTDTMAAMKARGITHVVECGPGKVLFGLVARNDASLVGAAVFDPASLAATQALLVEAA
jgi:[acyl-carrier-protein] S-malonyltransferase